MQKDKAEQHEWRGAPVDHHLTDTVFGGHELGDSIVTREQERASEHARCALNRVR